MTKIDWSTDTESAFDDWVAIHGYATKTAKTYKFMFFAFVAFIEKYGILLKDAKSTTITEYLKTRHSNVKTKDTYLWLLSDIFDHMIDNGEIDENPAERLLTTKKKNMRGRAAKRIPVFLSETETEKLLTHIGLFENDYSSQRRHCAILLLLGCGLRASEACSLKDENMHLDDENPYLTVIGKSNKERSIPVPDQIINSLLDFRDRRNKATPVFLSSKSLGNPYTPIGLYAMVHREMLAAGIMKTKMSPHVLRHTYCTAQLASGINLAVVKSWMGHDYISTTARYEHVQGARKGERPFI